MPRGGEHNGMLSSGIPGCTPGWLLLRVDARSGTVLLVDGVWLHDAAVLLTEAASVLLKATTPPFVASVKAACIFNAAA